MQNAHRMASPSDRGIRPEVYEEISIDPETVRGSDKKARLLLDAASDFCMRERPREEDIKVFREFFTQLIGTCRPADRRALSATIAPNAYVPRSIVFYLALDETEVAAPVLLLSPVIKEADIIALARKLSHAHLEILCRRNDLTPAGVVSLLAHGGRHTAELLAKNALAPRDAAPRLDQALPEHAARAEAEKVVAPADGRKIERPRQAPRTTIVPEETGFARFASARTDRSDELLALAAKGGRLGRDRSPPATVSLLQPRPAVESDEKKLARRLLDAARSGGQLAVADLMARKAQCSIEITAGLIAQESIEPLCVLMKGLGIDALPATQLILLMRPETGRSREDLARATGFYRLLDDTDCRHFVETLGGESNASERHKGSLADAISARRREIATREPMRPVSRPVRDVSGDIHPAEGSGRG